MPCTAFRAALLAPQPRQVQPRRGALECRAQEQQQGGVPPSRRQALAACGAAVAAALSATPARAGIVQDLLKAQLRPDVDPIDALVALMDARGVLYDIQALAKLPANSPEVVTTRALIPGFATRLRQVWL